MDSENPYTHMREFEEVCGTCVDQNVNEDTVRLKLFPFSLKDKAKMWLNTLESRSIGTWREMQTKFLKKYFPANRTASLQRQMMNFACKPTESFAQAWDRFKDLLLTCPHHAFEQWRVVSFFHDALTPNLKMLVSTMCNGEFYEKTPEEAFHFFDTLAENTRNWEVSPLSLEDSREHVSPQPRGKFQISESDNINARSTALTKKMEELELKKTKAVHEVEVLCVVCETNGHMTEDCPTIPTFKEVLYGQASGAQPRHTEGRPYQNQSGNYSGYNPNSNTYHPNSRNHPNFSWRNDSAAQPHAPFPSQPQSYQPNQGSSSAYQPPHRRSLEDTLQQFMQGQIGTNTQVAKFQEQTNRALEDMRSQLTKLTQTLSVREPGKFPSQPSPNPVRINIPLLDAIKQTLSYAKFLKDLCTVKRKINVQEKAFLMEQVSAILQFKTPPKYKDPGCPTITCIIGSQKVDQALLDLGASVNLLPFSVYQQLGLGELKPTRVTLQLADRSVKVPHGIVEDVLIQVDKFYFPVDFIVLDTQPHQGPQLPIPVILGRPFLATSNAIINCRNGIMKLSFGNMTVEMNVFKVAKQPNDEMELEEVDLVQTLSEEYFEKALYEQVIYKLEKQTSKGIEPDVESARVITQLMPGPEPLKLPGNETPPSLVRPPQLERKPLSNHLKYAFLGER
ncbi:uncharacterized protein LOC127791578 [Diospyros lotus]|uniref:uncharacterized protein LOC127791578 n=1 Tax=Diospyros lotus TaxID=55363 RepID=UPI00224F89E7|nr:uncharacterized protein LOC127791578 [Diospyros lotus]